jgi:hypothetical protein
MKTNVFVAASSTDSVPSWAHVAMETLGVSKCCNFDLIVNAVIATLHPMAAMR